MSMKNINKGFSLVEIMVTVAIIGILSSIAIPSYTNSIKKAKASEIIALYDNIKFHMAEYHLKNGRFPPNIPLAIRNQTAGLGIPTSYATKNIDRAWIGSKGLRGKPLSGVIAITFSDGDIRPTDAGLKMFIATVEKVGGRYIWKCNHRSSTATWKSNIDDKFLPERCRNQ